MMKTTSSNEPLRILCVVGARPNFIKISPLMRAFRARADEFDARLVHTGQHFDAAMKAAFFQQLNIPEPDVDLGVGGGSHAVQTAQIMLRFEPVIDEFSPHVVLVVGDVNSTLACALVAGKKQVAVVHVEAGLRSFDRAMPEEINRLLTDQIADLLFTTERDAVDNLLREGVAEAKIHEVGNVMIDTLISHRTDAVPSADTLQRIAAGRGAIGRFGVLTLHRPSSVDDPETLKHLVRLFVELSEKLPLVFPVHPRTHQRLQAAGLLEQLLASGIVVAEPLGYLEMLGLMLDAELVITDSGGLQEETTALGVPCLTIRENTERPITVSEGTNTVVGVDEAAIRTEFDRVLTTGGKRGRVPALWDGNAAGRIADILLEWASKQRKAA
ncbi:non-hydrolyzing UDP-N-acetylglucosamine 2-epimerase [Thiosocius teredinicola]|uniref:non-hydrolyzing UDP-N-acetylglucosamine 2-epimerase n=1 Tax=Thiosocius teredinicola TaxID=1973002 RepID=UPI002FE4E9A8